MSIFATFRSRRGFTLVETLVAISIFVVVIGLATGIFTNTLATDRKTEVSRNLYEESRIALERIVKEMRRGTIDYEEYWSWQHAETVTNYGQNYGQYAAKFYKNGSVTELDRAEVTRDSENIGKNTTSQTALGDASPATVYGREHCEIGKTPVAPNNNSYEQCELYLITADGMEKTIFKLLPVTVPERPAGDRTEYRLGVLKLSGIDADGDGTIESWQPLPDFTGYAFQLLQPDSINIKNLKFFIAPLDDPRKAFADFTDNIQIQPHVSILLTAEPSFLRQAGVRGKVPQITLQTTVTARAQTEVKSLN